MKNDPGQTILVWSGRAQRPDPRSWNIGASHAEQTAGVWLSLRHAINYAVGMREDREAVGLHPWIRTPQGHVYSPATIMVMAEVMQSDRQRDRARAAG